MFKSLIERLQLSLHDSVTSAASALKVNPEIAAAHLEGRAEIKDARLCVHDAKVEKSTRLRSQKRDQKVELKSVKDRQQKDRHALKAEADAKIEQARDLLAQTQEVAAKRLENVRNRLALARLQGLVTGAGPLTIDV